MPAYSSEALDANNICSPLADPSIFSGLLSPACLAAYLLGGRAGGGIQIQHIQRAKLLVHTFQRSSAAHAKPEHGERTRVLLLAVFFFVLVRTVMT